MNDDLPTPLCPLMRVVLPFNNCIHINEQDCAIKQAVRDGEIDEDRYVSYVNILESLKENNWE